MKIVLIGVQGAGKSTQGKMLSEALGIPYLSSGHIFRQMAKQKTALGRWVKETLNAGVLIPDEKTIEIVLEYLQRPEYKNGYIIDGFPRTVPQVEAFSDGTEKAVLIDVSDKEALWRISGRVEDREDETLQAIRKRIELFHKVTAEVLDYYESKGQLIKINGEQSVEEVFEETLKKLQASNEN
ncbi:MAG TPA: nucleoside monophosphate kinase [Candidatus Woesebacteria bacterium]|nr:nucleoside monophosphate kinase [Candidatus Woesebacteria bacterium]